MSVFNNQRQLLFKGGCDEDSLNIGTSGMLTSLTWAASMNASQNIFLRAQKFRYEVWYLFECDAPHLNLPSDHWLSFPLKIVKRSTTVHEALCWQLTYKAFNPTYNLEPMTVGSPCYLKHMTPVGTSRYSYSRKATTHINKTTRKVLVMPDRKPSEDAPFIGKRHMMDSQDSAPLRFLLIHLHFRHSPDDFCGKLDFLSLPRNKRHNGSAWNQHYV